MKAFSRFQCLFRAGCGRIERLPRKRIAGQETKRTQVPARRRVEIGGVIEDRQSHRRPVKGSFPVHPTGSPAKDARFTAETFRILRIAAVLLVERRTQTNPNYRVLM